MISTTYSETISELGEGPLWHPTRNQLFWFDVLGMCLHSSVSGEQITWQFDEHVSAAGWVDHDTLLMASETCLSLFDIETGETEFLCALEAENDSTRSNDGRADPFGGFWIGTMSKTSVPKAGAIYRYFEGQLRKLVGNLTVPNSICFSPDGRYAYYCDTPSGKIMRLDLDDEGWPLGKPTLFIAQAGAPDGSVVDADGNLWNADWHLRRVSCYAPTSEKLRHIDIEATHVTCPAFGGENGTTLFVTTARPTSQDPALKALPTDGHVLEIATVAQGRPEPQVAL
ncbi:sugar lactone lactonase YvrE [Pacificibacter maritimus]|uniref:Sugar lactone lactonase YvrE n=1 Tax=Pacificibacter maritimus TaxID=762213 RepID=A0A3N4UDE3_9RHOB|nr:SMP-30/gluconolactonase/LRE family protein [Pacificibacter maritimus]RPE66455.1 sugar lactone lactonase YvrE [Pacificibacter maritimus]